MRYRGSQLKIAGPLTGAGLNHSLLMGGGWLFPHSGCCWERGACGVLLLKNWQRLRQARGLGNLQRLRQEVMQNRDQS